VPLLGLAVLFLVATAALTAHVLIFQVGGRREKIDLATKISAGFIAASRRFSQNLSNLKPF